MAILFIGAHPDDIELGCGGTICYYLENKYEVFCYHLTNGEYKDLNGNIVRDFEEVYKTSLESLGLLGVKKENIFFTEIPATQLKVEKELISNLQRFIIKNNIDTIFTHSNPDTYHQDHRATHFISMASARKYVNNIFLFEIIFNFASGLMIPNFYIDISKWLDKKIKALRLHKTEYIKFDGEKWIDSIITLARYRGFQVDCNYAEAFYIMKYLLK
ncbi:MAG: PIG-L deacetylase family protein [Promethearchaeota archaeon]